MILLWVNGEDKPSSRRTIAVEESAADNRWNGEVMVKLTSIDRQFADTRGGAREEGCGGGPPHILYVSLLYHLMEGVQALCRRALPPCV